MQFKSPSSPLKHDAKKKESAWLARTESQRTKNQKSLKQR